MQRQTPGYYIPISLTEITGKKRNRLFSYTEYINILNDGTERIPL